MLQLLHLFGILMILNSLGFFIWLVREYYHASQSPTWPIVDGTITQSYIQKKYRNGGRTYHAIIHFKYKINNIEYEGKKRCFTYMATSFIKHAEDILSIYPVGKNVDVFHHPDKPKVSVLEVGTNAGIPFILAIIIVFFILGIWLVNK